MLFPDGNEQSGVVLTPNDPTLPECLAVQPSIVKLPTCYGIAGPKTKKISISVHFHRFRVGSDKIEIE